MDLRIGEQLQAVLEHLSNHAQCLSILWHYCRLLLLQWPPVIYITLWRSLGRRFTHHLYKLVHKLEPLLAFCSWLKGDKEKKSWYLVFWSRRWLFWDHTGCGRVTRNLSLLFCKPLLPGIRWHWSWGRSLSTLERALSRRAGGLSLQCRPRR